MPPQSTALPHRTPRLATSVPPRPADAATTLHRQPVSRLPIQSRIGVAPSRPAQPARITQPTRTAQPIRTTQPIRTVQPVPTPPRRGLWTDRSAWLATVDGRALALTYLEFEVLDFFVHHPGTAHSRQALLSSVWGHRPDDQTAPDPRTVDVLVTRLRRKLGPEYRFRIETVRRVGYRYRPLEPVIG
ncbi:Response regulator with CheY-like receiver domain and winged-helix DNA-binding domain [Frankia sp. AiPs1]|uniref:winged helix-turn-helix domain-containing protein n=1 Tax=Frankia sp. AiPa1 TaxID=573492 RepID=UPI00202B2881|nr:winged helix-turn-helix domain-containing protein [Frankia sp. AiPa1]MCL9759711.1 winged helix-turn-helix domain-containing protein [Frankia sp. AiPa1]